jgi:hypothetical protein
VISCNCGKDCGKQNALYQIAFRARAAEVRETLLLKVLGGRELSEL